MTSRTALLAMFVFALSLPQAQDSGTLRIKVTVIDADQHVRPVPRHALLISDNPSTSAPRRVVTSSEGTAEIRLRPGNYTIESDRPLVFQGKSYEWVQTLDVAAGRDTSLDLNAANAQAASTTASSTLPPGESSPSELLMQWQDTVVSIWSPTARGAAFLIDRRGLLLTNQRIVGTATSVEVQLTRTKKVAARVLAADRARDVAVLWITPTAVASLRPAKLGSAKGLADAQEVFAIDAFAIEQKTLASGNVASIDPHAIASDVRVDDANSGTPLLTAAGEAVGIITPEEAPGGRTRAVPIDDARPVIADAEKKMQGGTAPAATPLPIEPQRPFPQDVLDAALKQRVASAAGYELHAADFDVTFITPVLVYLSHHEPERTTGAKTPGGRQDIVEMENARRALVDFGNWDDYVSATPPVLMVRATPKLVEGFWTTVGRAAAQTQGVSLPPFKHMKGSFSRLRLYCGTAEVTPIHPFTIERRIDENNAVSEGLYVYDAAAIGPHCGKVTLSLFSEKQPDKPDTRTIDPKILQQLASDLAPYLAGR